MPTRLPSIPLVERVFRAGNRVSTVLLGLNYLFRRVQIKNTSLTVLIYLQSSSYSANERKLS